LLFSRPGFFVGVNLLADISIQRIKSLNAAFKSNDLHRICSTVEKSVRQLDNILQFAKSVGVDRTTVYRSFQSKRGPKLTLVVKSIQACGLSLVVEAHRQSASGMRVSKRLTIAFSSKEASSIIQALADVMRAQVNVSEFATRTGVTRSGLYRAFYVGRSPQLSTVLGVLNALGLHLQVKTP
jgi:probable addiction module antidote protein